MLRPNNPEDQRRRDALRYAICKAWRKQGHRVWSDADIEAAIAKQDQRNAANNQSNAVQADLIDHGCYAGRTRAAAASSARRSRHRRRDAVECAVAGAGVRGMTRHEAADAVGCPVHAVTAAVLDLLKAGRLIETSRKRATPSGKLAAVLVSPLVKESQRA